MRSHRSAIGSLVIAFALGRFSCAQQSPASTPPASQNDTTQTLQLTVQEVVLDVVVTDVKGNALTNLTQDDFQILDDKVPQLIRSFTPPPPPNAPLPPAIHSTAELDRVAPTSPVTIIVLDEINTRFEDEAFARYSLKKFLDTQGETLKTPTLLGAVNLKHFTLLHDYTTSKQELLSALEHHLVVEPWHLDGTSWKAEQFNASFEALLEIAKATAGHPGHKSLLWLGRGFPPFDPTTLTQEASNGMEQIITACLNAMRDGRISLYTLDPAGISMEPEEVDSDGFDIDPFGEQIDFYRMARLSGGHAFYGRNDVDKLIETSSRDGANFYTLTYTPSTPRTDANAFHSIRVVLRNPGLTAETREGYYARMPPPEEGIGSKHADRKQFDLGIAAQSVMVYDAVHVVVDPVTDSPDQFRISLNAADLQWQDVGSQKLNCKVLVLAESYDKSGKQLNRTSKISTLQVVQSHTQDVPDSVTVHLFTTISTKAPATRLRFVVRDETNQKVGAINLDLTPKTIGGTGTR